MWNPPPNVTGHQGAPLAIDSDFFVDPPPDIGPILTAHTSLKRGVSPKSAVTRLAIGLACGAALELLILAIDQSTGFLSAKLRGDTDPPLALVLVPVVLLGAVIAWLMTRFTHVCNYVGEYGLAQFICKRRPANISGRSLFHFKNANSLVTTRTEHYKNTAYVNTTYGFYWYSSPLAKSVFGFKGSHTSGSASPPPEHGYHFCRSAESAWYNHLAPLLEAELAQKGRVSFYTGHSGWTALGPGFIEITDRNGNVTRFMADDIGTASMVNHILQIFRPGVFFNPLDFSKREGVYRFDLTSHNLPMFRYLFKRCLGADI